MDNTNDIKNFDGDILLLDNEFEPVPIEEEGEAVKPILKEFMESYTNNFDKPVEEWLTPRIQEQLPDRRPDEVETMVSEIVKSLNQAEESKKSLEKAINNGRSKESWFAYETQKALSAMSTQQSVEYLNNLDNALQTANEALYRTITTQSGAINQNPRLAGFIAEQYHAQTFNLNAEATGSQYRAKVLEPTGNGYAKNSVDIAIVDGNGKTVRRYQSKYCKNAEATAKAFEHGDYRGQQKLVPDGQQGDIAKKVTTVIEAPDGTASNPLSKSSSERMKDEAQSGNWNELNWNEYKTRDLAVGVAKQVGTMALQGAAIGTGFYVAEKLFKGEEINGDEVLETALKSGADYGVKAAAAGAIKVGAEKGILSAIPKGTPAGTIANIAFVAVEDAKVVADIATGELTLEEGLNKLECTTVSTVSGLMAGAAAAGAIGSFLGPVGTVVGGICGFVGGAVGYMAGSKAGEAITKGRQKVRKWVSEKITEGVSKIRDVCSEIGSGIKEIGSGIKDFFSGIFS